MEIEKIKLTQAMRKDAVYKAVHHKFTKRVDAFKQEMITVVSVLVINDPSNAELISDYSTLTDAMRKLVMLQGTINVCRERDEGECHANGYLHTVLYVDLPFLSSNGKDACAVFGEYNGHSYTKQHVSLHHSLPLSKTTFTYPKGKYPASLSKILAKRKALIREITDFGTDVYHALYQVKNIKEVRQHIPALEQFLDIQDKQFTKLVPYAFYNKVNKSINVE